MKNKDNENFWKTPFWGNYNSLQKNSPPEWQHWGTSFIIPSMPIFSFFVVQQQYTLDNGQGREEETREITFGPWKRYPPSRSGDWLEDRTSASLYEAGHSKWKIQSAGFRSVRTMERHLRMISSQLNLWDEPPTEIGWVGNYWRIPGDIDKGAWGRYMKMSARERIFKNNIKINNVGK